MPVSDITQAILAEANAQANEPYSTARKIKGYLRNKVQGGIRSAVGGSTDAKSMAKVVGRNAVTVREMTEMMQREGAVKITNDDVIGKMHDAVRKVDTAYTAAKDAIMQAKDCDSIYKAAKNYAYLKYRVVRLQYYIEAIRAHLDEISAMNERHGAQIIGFEADLVEIMDQWFETAGAEYHTKNCKNKETCYYKLHGLA
ncbi:MAG TPA: hypothetical protein VFV10_02130 [Gammaproteobacteria bacterium]|nr:hypothetical protein [Gammaproteobacteria bacterium]